MKNILITTVPFGQISHKPLELLNGNENIKYIINPIGRRLKEDELFDLIKDFDIVIAGTEKITKRIMLNAPNLKLISRVGVGLDSVDLKSARELGIQVSYTPEAPSPAVAELTIAQMLCLLRNIPHINQKMKNQIWFRYIGERLSNQTIGIIGTGRIGSKVLKHLLGFEPKRILVNDLKPNYDLYKKFNAEHVEKKYIYKESDIITLHVPLTCVTRNLITQKEIQLFKKNVYLINTSRGGIINEKDLYDSLVEKRIKGAALDVFEVEPYSGPLAALDNCLISCHTGSMTSDCRVRMEIESTEEAIRFVNGEQLCNPVPEEEYNQ